MKRKHKLLVIVGAAVTVMAIGVAGWYLFLRPSQPQGPSPYNPHDIVIAKLLADGEPKDALPKAIYYAQLGQNYELVGNYDAALTNFLQAQAIIDSNKLGDQITYYAALTDVYRAKNDKANVKLYLTKQLTSLEEFLKAHPDDTATKNAIKNIQDQVRAL